MSRNVAFEYLKKSSPGISPRTARLPRVSENKRVGEESQSSLSLPSLSLGTSRNTSPGFNRLNTSNALFGRFDLSFKLGKLGLEKGELRPTVRPCLSACTVTLALFSLLYKLAKNREERCSPLFNFLFKVFNGLFTPPIAIHSTCFTNHVPVALPM